jgi:uncharacterized membrane protein
MEHCPMDQTQPEAPAYQPPTEQITPGVPVVNEKRKTLALWLLIGPTALIVTAVILYAVANFIIASTAPTPGNGEMFGAPSTFGMVVNVVLFLVGSVSVITWLPGIIIGIILLTTQKKA